MPIHKNEPAKPFETNHFKMQICMIISYQIQLLLFEIQIGLGLSSLCQSFFE